MSVGNCWCPCGDWGHDGAACTGTADTSLPVRRTFDGNLGQPLCHYCRIEIAKVDDRNVITPPGRTL